MLERGMGYEEREALRRRYREQALAEAAGRGLTLRCQRARRLDGADPALVRAEHQACRGESRGGGGCLCECHDPIAAIIGTGGDEGMRGMTEVQTSGQVAYEALARAAGSDPTWPAGATMRAWDRLPPNQQAAWEAAAQAVAVAERERIRQLAIQHDAFYDAPCPDGASDCIHQDTPFADLITEPSGD